MRLILVIFSTLLITAEMFAMPATPPYSGEPEHTETRSDWEFMAQGQGGVSWLSRANSNWVCYIPNEHSVLINTIQTGLAMEKKVKIVWHNWNVPVSTEGTFEPVESIQCRVHAASIVD